VLYEDQSSSRKKKISMLGTLSLLMYTKLRHIHTRGHPRHGGEECIPRRSLSDRLADFVGSYGLFSEN
jgi:hypothetical protein